MSTIERAIEIAARAHAGQLDNAGAPYILHPLRQMLKVETDDQRNVAVLHDVVEDTDWTLERLRDEGFSADVLAAVDSLTRRSGESYDDFVDRVSRNAIGRRVKMADLDDNLDLSRIAEPTEEDYARVLKYLRALTRLRAIGDGSRQ